MGGRNSSRHTLIIISDFSPRRAFIIDLKATAIESEEIIQIPPTETFSEASELLRGASLKRNLLRLFTRLKASSGEFSVDARVSFL